MGTFRIRTRTKKKIKKAIKKYGPAVALLIFTIALLFKACKIETPYTLLSEAVPKTFSLNAFEIKNQISVLSQKNGNENTDHFEKNIKISGYNTNQVISYVDSETITFYNEDEYSYAVINGDSMKFQKGNIPSDYLEFVSVVNEVEHMLIALPEILLEDVKIQKEDHLKVISLQLAVNLFSQYYDQYVTETKNAIMQYYGLDDFSLSSMASITISVGQDDYLDSYTISYQGKGIQKTEGIQKELTFSVEDRMIITKTQDVSIQPMEGYWDFYENVSAPYHLLNQAMIQTNALDAIDASYALNMNVDMPLLEEPVDIPIYAVLQATGMQSGKPNVYSKRNISVLDVEKETEVYREGSYYYISVGGKGVKLKAGAYTHSYDVLSDLKELTLMLPERILMMGTITENADGTRVIAVSVPKTDVGEMFDFHIHEVMIAISNEAKLLTVSPTDATVLVTISSDGYLLSYSCRFDMDMTLDMTKEIDANGVAQMDVKAKVDAVVTYAHPSTPVTVTPMEGYESFNHIEY